MENDSKQTFRQDIEEAKNRAAQENPNTANQSWSRHNADVRRQLNAMERDRRR